MAEQKLPETPVGPWPYDPNYGDGVSRTDPRTWSSAAAIQQIVDDRRSDADMNTLKEESAFAREIARCMGSMRQTMFDACDIVEGRTVGDFESARKELDRLMQATQESCERWARIFEDIYQKKDATDDHLVALCKRFWQRCPEYGYPCAPTLHDSVYAVDPMASSVWSASVEEIELARQKRAGVPKGALDKDELSIRHATPAFPNSGTSNPDEIPEFGNADELDLDDMLHCIDQLDGIELADISDGPSSVGTAPPRRRKASSVMNSDAPIRLVADTATKREQQYTKAVRRMFTEVPDAHPDAGTTSLLEDSK